MADTRALALRILIANTVVLGLLAVMTWVGWFPVFEPRRGMMTTAFAACAALDAVFALVLVSRT